ncbi:hypothetical protein GF324_11255, partial [bacterium]|nr:hypothetical protein [bacterium]
MHRTVRCASLILALTLLFAGEAPASRGSNAPSRGTDADDYWHYTSVGNLGLSITNFGILGHGWNRPDNPSCMYKIRTNVLQEQVEHFSYAGVWVGGIRQGVEHVSTGIMDGVFGYEDGGWEFTTSAQEQVPYNPIFVHLNKIDRRYDFSRAEADGIVTFGGALNGQIENGYIDFGSTSWDTMITASSIRDASVNNPYADYAQFFDPNAISHQDLVCSFTDTNDVVPGTGVSIPNHEPLGVHVYQEAYAWYEPFADAFNILNYTVTNIPTGWFIADEDTVMTYDTGMEVEYAAGDTVWLGTVLEAPTFGLWVDASVGNMHYTPDSNYDPNGGPGGRWYWYDNLNAWDAQRRLGISFDYDGDAGWAQSYLGVKVLGGSPVEENDSLHTNYRQWTWQGNTFPSDFPMPENESERYRYMFTPGNVPYTGEEYQQSWMMMISAGPFPDMAPGQRFNIAMAVVCGLWNGSGDDLTDSNGDGIPDRREYLYKNAEWAQIAYNGEDRNGNNILDPGEDLDGDGIIDRYILPSSPPSPALVVVPGNH